MPGKFSRLSLLLLLLAVPSAAQRTWVVDTAGGPNVDFTDVPPAVAAAAPGDTILVVPQVCGLTPPAPIYTRPVISKGLILTTTGVGASVNFSDRILVRDVPANEVVVIRDLRMSHGGGGRSTGLFVARCMGPVQIERFEVRDNHGSYMCAIDIVDCPDVTLNDCYVWLQSGQLHLRRSAAFLIRTTLKGQQRPDFSNAQWQVYPPLRLTDSEAALVGCSVSGQNGSSQSGPSCGTPGTPVASPIQADNATLYLGRETVLLGGRRSAGSMICGGSGSCTPIQGANYVVEMDPTVVFECPGLTPTGSIGAVYTDTARFGASWSATVSSGDASFVMLVAGFTTPSPLATQFGRVYLDPGLLLVVGIAPVNGVGEATFPVAASLPAGTLIGLQAVALTTTGGFETTLPARVVVVP